MIDHRTPDNVLGLQLSREGNLPLLFDDGTSANGTTSNALSNSAATNLGLGSLSLKLNQRVGIVVLQWN